MKHKVSGVVVVCDLESSVEKCLDSIFSQGSFLDEVVVVSNGVERGRLKMLEKYDDEITFVQSDVNTGVASARKLGVELTRGKYVLFLDDDAWIKQGEVERLVDTFKKHKRVGLVSPKVISNDGLVQYTCRKFPSLRAIFLWWWVGKTGGEMRSQILREYLMVNRDKSKTIEVDWTTGVCQLVDRRVYDQIGGLDDKFFYGYEDVDYCYRLRRAGYKVMHNPSVVVGHKGRRRSNQGIFNRYTWYHVSGIIRFFVKNRYCQV